MSSKGLLTAPGYLLQSARKIVDQLRSLSNKSDRKANTSLTVNRVSQSHRLPALGCKRRVESDLWYVPVLKVQKAPTAKILTVTYTVKFN
jgi:hypothetical protein